MNQQVGSLSVRVGVQCAGVLSFLEYLQDAVTSGDITPVTATKLEELLKGVTVVTASPDANVERNRQLLLDRSVVGLKKYGVTTERTDLNLSQWLQHILEELLDAANYVQAAKMQMQRDSERLARAELLMQSFVQRADDLPKNHGGFKVMAEVFRQFLENKTPIEDAPDKVSS